MQEASQMAGNDSIKLELANSLHETWVCATLLIAHGLLLYFVWA